MPSSELAETRRLSQFESNQIGGGDFNRHVSADRLPVTTVRLAPRDGPEVSDQLSISNSVIGLVAASSQTFNDLVDLNVVPEKNTSAINTACNAVKSFKATIHVLYKIFRQFEGNSLARPERTGFIELDVVVAILTESALVLSDLGNKLADISDEAEELSVSTTILCHRHGESIFENARRVQKADSVITKLLSVLQVGDEFEALRHRDQADGLVKGLMESDIDLADRMQQMRDVFGARALVPRERIEAVTMHAPPGYSVPVAHSEELPEYSRTGINGQNEDGSVTIRPGSWSIFSGLTFADVSILSLIPLPLHSGELRYGVLYTNEYCRAVNEDLGKLADQSVKQKNLHLAKILGLRAVGSNHEQESFARRVGLQYDDYSTRGGPRLRPQPELRRPLG